MTDNEVLAMLQAESWFSRKALELGGQVPSTVLDRLPSDEMAWREFAPLLWPAMQAAWNAVRAAGGRPERLPLEDLKKAFTQGFVKSIHPDLV